MLSDKKNTNIVFMGTPVFAVATLEAIINNGFKVTGVITVPDKPSGRGRKNKPSPVKETAIKKNIPLLQPDSLKCPIFIDTLKQWQPDIIVVVAFRKLPESVWKIPQLGTFNLHASLLPDYRGAAPIQRAIINGEKFTGITTFFINNEIDTGDIILQEKIKIGDNETAGELHDRMMFQGAKLVVKTLNMIIDGSVSPKPQSTIEYQKKNYNTAPKITKSETIINWSLPAKDIHNLIRGFSPVPGATLYLCKNDEKPRSIKVYRSELLLQEQNVDKPTLKSDGKSCIEILLPDGKISLLDVQMSSKKRMKSEEFLKGFDINNGWELCF